MADVNVTISDAAIISALNKPGGGVSNWRDQVMLEAETMAAALSPVNDPLNAMHRGGVTGTYKAGWFSHRTIGGNQHRVGFKLGNRVNHAQYVEYGTAGSAEFQLFSWTEWGGGIKWVGPPTPRNFKRGRGFPYSGMRLQRGYEGQHVMRDALNAVLSSATFNYVPF